MSNAVAFPNGLPLLTPERVAQLQAAMPTHADLVSDCEAWLQWHAEGGSTAPRPVQAGERIRAALRARA